VQRGKLLSGQNLPAPRVPVRRGDPGSDQTGQRRPVVGGGAGDDPVEVRWIPLRQDQSFAPAVGDPAEVGISGLPPVEGARPITV